MSLLLAPGVQLRICRPVLRLFCFDTAAPASVKQPLSEQKQKEYLD
jgi:hypothetical protein